MHRATDKPKVALVGGAKGWKPRGIRVSARSPRPEKSRVRLRHRRGARSALVPSGVRCGTVSRPPAASISAPAAPWGDRRGYLRAKAGTLTGRGAFAYGTAALNATKSKGGHVETPLRPSPLPWRGFHLGVGEARRRQGRSHCTAPPNNERGLSVGFVKAGCRRSWTKFDGAEGPIRARRPGGARASSTSPHPAPSAVASGCRLLSLPGIRLRLCREPMDG